MVRKASWERPRWRKEPARLEKGSRLGKRECWKELTGGNPLELEWDLRLGKRECRKEIAVD